MRPRGGALAGRLAGAVAATATVLACTATPPAAPGRASGSASPSASPTHTPSPSSGVTVGPSAPGAPSTAPPTHPTSPATPHPTAAPRGTALAVARGPFGLTREMRAVFAVRPRAGEDVQHLVAAGHYLAWAGGKPGSYHYDPSLNVFDDNLHEVHVLDTRTSRVQVFPAAQPDAITTPFGITGDWVVWRESIPTPPRTCGRPHCARWTIYARNVVTGQARTVDSSAGRAVPHLQEPRLAVASGYVAWMRMAPGDEGVEHVTTRLADGVTRVIYRHERGSSQISISGRYAYFNRFNGMTDDHTLIAAPLAGGPLTELARERDILRVRVIGSRVAWTTRFESDRAAVKILNLADDEPAARELLDEAEFYTVGWPSAGYLYAESNIDWRLVRDPTGTRPRVSNVFDYDRGHTLARPVIADDGSLAFTHSSDKNGRLPTAIVIARPVTV